TSTCNGADPETNGILLGSDSIPDLDGIYTITFTLANDLQPADQPPDTGLWGGVVFVKATVPSHKRCVGGTDPPGTACTVNSDCQSNDCQQDYDFYKDANLAAIGTLPHCIPTVSQWGLAALTLMLLSASTIIIRRNLAG
ncbi:MAG: IPTL-CTERM sorting domain-containing protein, partial [Phycisphaerales bacterium]|nr:IPTL-CTERM sorting domain-containing protein [Phycisphaerales bacterium]